MASKKGGWKQSLQAAIEDAMRDVGDNEEVAIELIEARKRGNPIHEYRVTVRT